MIYERARSKLGDCEESRSGKVLVSFILRLAARDEGGHWQSREIVARQKTFAGEVPVRVKIGLKRTLGVEQELNLSDRLSPQARCTFALLFRSIASLLD